MFNIPVLGNSIQPNSPLMYLLAIVGGFKQETIAKLLKTTLRR